MGSIILGTPVTLTLRTDMGTPNDQLQYEGFGLTIPEGVPLPPDGEFSDITAWGITVYGYVRTVAGGAKEFLIQAAPDPALIKVDAIPGPAGWHDQGARQLYLGQAKYLLGAGITEAVLWPGIKAFYDNAAADLSAKGWTPAP